MGFRSSWPQISGTEAPLETRNAAKSLSNNAGATCLYCAGEGRCANAEPLPKSAQRYVREDGPLGAWCCRITPFCTYRESDYPPGTLCRNVDSVAPEATNSRPTAQVGPGKGSAHRV